MHGVPAGRCHRPMSTPGAITRWVPVSMRDRPSPDRPATRTHRGVRQVDADARPPGCAPGPGCCSGHRSRPPSVITCSRARVLRAARGQHLNDSSGLRAQQHGRRCAATNASFLVRASLPSRVTSWGHPATYQALSQEGHMSSFPVHPNTLSNQLTGRVAPSVGSSGAPVQSGGR